MAGYNTTSGNNNILIGPKSGTAVNTGDDNGLLGYQAQAGDGQGSHHVISGLWAGASNTLIGHQASAAAGALHHATAIGAGAMVASSNSVVLGHNANVGIGTSTPTARLEINSGTANESGVQFSRLTSDSPAQLAATDKVLTIDQQGRVVLARAGHYLVAHVADWADHVLAAAYPLAPLFQVERYINHHQHLPGMASAEEVVKQGVAIKKRNAQLLGKIEELTLYSIQRARANDQQTQLIAALMRKQAKLERRVQRVLNVAKRR